MSYFMQTNLGARNYRAMECGDGSACMANVVKPAAANREMAKGEDITYLCLCKRLLTRKMLLVTNGEKIHS